MSYESLARSLLLRLSEKNNEKETETMDRNKSNKPVFPTHINLNLQALPCKFKFKSQIRKFYGLSNFCIKF